MIEDRIKIHQIWMGPKIPKRFVNQSMPTWMDESKFEYKLWLREELGDIEFSGIRRIVKTHYRRKYQFYSDLFRYQILRDHGGLYVDCDMKMLKDIRKILNYDYPAMFVPSVKCQQPRKSRGNSPCNGLIWMPKANHPAMYQIIGAVQKRIINVKDPRSKRVHMISGSFNFGGAIKRHKIKLWKPPIFLNCHRKLRQTYVHIV